jgi:dynein heavy chain, axonemal
MATTHSIDNVDSMLRLWVHECQRVFQDRLIRSKSNDEKKFFDILTQKCNDHLGKEMSGLLADCLDPKVGPLFVAYLHEADDNGHVTYEEACDYQKIRQVVEEKLEDYNMEPKLISMDLAMFRGMYTTAVCVLI